MSGTGSGQLNRAMVNYYQVVIIPWTNTGGTWTRAAAAEIRAASKSGYFDPAMGVFSELFVPVEVGKKYELLLLVGYKGETAQYSDLIVNRYYTTNVILPRSNLANDPPDLAAQGYGATQTYTVPMLDYTQCEFDLVDGGSPIKPARDATPQKVMRVSLPRKKSDTEVVLADGTTEAWASSPEITVPIAGLAGFIAYKNAEAGSGFPNVSNTAANGGLSVTFPSACWNTSSLLSFGLYIQTVFVIPASTSNSPLPQSSYPFNTGQMGYGYINNAGNTSFTAATVNAVGSGMKGTLVLNPASVTYPDEDCEVYLRIFGELEIFSEVWLIRPGTDWTVDEEGRSGSAILATFGDKSKITLTPLTAPGGFIYMYSMYP
jgi:hypothetical protein